MATISDILEKIQGYAPDAEIAPVMQAYVLAARAHQGQTRKSGEAYLTHPLAVAYILSDMKMDVDTIAAALLHDALEDNPLSREEMAEQVGEVITEIVEGVTKIGKLKYRSVEELQAENFRKMMLAMSKDLRVILVKIADRLHNMRTLDGHKVEKRRLIATETMEVFAPIANRLGLTRLKADLEDLCMRHLEPEAYERVESYLDETQSDREAYTGRVVAALVKLLAEAGMTGDVSGRAKAHSSILKKMKNQALDVAEVPDLLAFRMIMPDIGGCYSALGMIHGSYAPVPGRIKDYIARPKPNGYQSLHTTVVGPEGKRVEVQIRTAEMHRIAEDGIAAHWRYKEGHLALSRDDVLKISRIRELFEQTSEAENAAEFMETVKVEFYADEVFVFTPAGEVKRFPRGATPIDFAYAVHSDVGQHCVGARIHGRMVSLGYGLRSGDSVEILTSPTQKPRRDWLEMARTGRAISKIRRYLRQEEEEQALRMGREILEAELKRLEWSIKRVQADGRVEEYLRHRNFRTLEHVYVDLARGNASIGEVAKALLPEGEWVSRSEEAQRNRLSNIFTRLTTRRAQSPVLITGEDGVLVSYAGCCNPLPGEEVVGFITRGRGISVHRGDCAALSRLEPDRRILVQWDLTNETRHSNTLAIHCQDRPGLLAAITKVCEMAKVNIERAEARALGGDNGVVTLQLAVRNLSELTRVIRNVEKIAGVELVERMAG